MIIAKVFYGVKCDRCGKVYDGADAEYYADVDSALEYAKEEDWIEQGKKHYCQSCYVVDEDTEEVKVRLPRPIHLDSLEKFINGFLGCRARVIENKDDCEVLFYGEGLSIIDEEYIREMLGSNLISLQCKPHERMWLTECVIKIKK